MDISKQANESNAGISMYFDAESNISVSSVAFRTLEALSDNSNNSPAQIETALEDSHDMNNTLEAVPNANLLTLKKQQLTNSPLRPFHKNIMSQFQASCSTPTKNELLRSMEEVNRNLEGQSIIESISGVEMKGKENIVPEKCENSKIEREDKENTHPEKSAENSTLSNCSSVGIVTVIARKDIVESDPLEENEQITNKPNTSLMQPTKIFVEKETRLRAISQRKSMALCEPDLRTNRPSRIVPPKIPKLLLTAPYSVKSSSTDIPKMKKNRTSMLPTTQAQAEKRPSQYASRMSVIVQTTLNSPARKLSRRTVFTQLPTFSAAASARRSVAVKSKEPIPPVIRQARMSVVSTKTQTFPTVAKTLPIYSGKSEIKPTSLICNVCSLEFRIKSLLEAHKRSHEDVVVPAFVRKAPIGASTTVSKSSTSMSQCKYCDKKFALARALHIHLMQNCSKIPPQEKRKLNFTEMEHVEKAQLPVFAPSGNNSSSNSSRSHTPLNGNELLYKQKEQLKPPSQQEVKHLANDLAAALGNMQVSPNEIQQMAPPSSLKVKKSAAHSGVYRTPTKYVPCHICKISFKSILEYTNHNLSLHTSGHINQNSLN